MKMYKCDRCGRIFEPRKVWELQFSRLPYHVDDESRDLCSECITELRNFLVGAELHKENEGGR